VLSTRGPEVRHRHAAIEGEPGAQQVSGIETRWISNPSLSLPCAWTLPDCHHWWSGGYHES